MRAIEEHAPGETIFKGGTSLEKQRLIERFSEDIDLLVIGVYDSRRAVERALKGMCSAAQNALPGSVLMLHPVRTLLEKLLRVNNFVVYEARRSDHGWPRIGRQFYDIWALLGNDQVLTFLQDRVTAAEVLADCIQVSEDFAPDLPPPSGGFAACEAFNPDWGHASQLRAEHERAMRDLYYGAATPPNYDEVIDRIRSNARLLDLAR